MARLPISLAAAAAFAIAVACAPKSAAPEGVTATALPLPEGLVKQPNVAGMFYPADAEGLRAVVAEKIEAASTLYNAADVVAIFTPHAGYDYSGGVAGLAFKQVTGRRPTTVVLLGPSHHVAAPEVAAPTYDAFATPLGTVKVDEPFIAAVERSCGVVRRDNVPFAREHCLEVQLPFVQALFPGARIAPFIFCYHDATAAVSFGKSLAAVIKEAPGDIVIVATCDLSHYHPYPEAVKLDTAFVRSFERFDAGAVFAGVEADEFEIDAPAVVAAAFVAAKELGGVSARALTYKNSGDITGDKGNVVGYLAGVVVK